MSDRVPAIRVLLLPKDTNAYGTIFGGVILSHIDLASAVEARKVAPHRYVTKAMREVEFHEPVFSATSSASTPRPCASAARRSRCGCWWRPSAGAVPARSVPAGGTGHGEAGQGDRSGGGAGGGWTTDGRPDPGPSRDAAQGITR